MREIPFLPDRELWVRTVRERDNLAAQLAQARADLIHVTEQWHGAEKKLDAARAEVARLTAALTEADTSAQMMADEFYEVSEGAYLIDPVVFDAHRQAIRAALRGDTAPAKSDGGWHNFVTSFPDAPAPAKE